MSIQLLRFNSSLSAQGPASFTAGWLPRDKPNRSEVHVLASNCNFVKVRFKKTTRHIAGLNKSKCDGHLLVWDNDCLLQIALQILVLCVTQWR